MAAATAQVVRHVEDYQRRQTQRQNRRREHEVPAHIGGIQHQQHGFRFGSVGALSGKNVVRYLLVFRSRRKAVDARQVDISRTVRPSGRAAMPVCCSTVTPGKLATF